MTATKRILTLLITTTMIAGGCVDKNRTTSPTATTPTPPTRTAPLTTADDIFKRLEEGKIKDWELSSQIKELSSQELKKLAQKKGDDGETFLESLLTREISLSTPEIVRAILTATDPTGDSLKKALKKLKKRKGLTDDPSALIQVHAVFVEKEPALIKKYNTDFQVTIMEAIKNDEALMRAFSLVRNGFVDRVGRRTPHSLYGRIMVNLESEDRKDFRNELFNLYQGNAVVFVEKAQSFGLTPADLMAEDYSFDGKVGKFPVVYLAIMSERGGADRENVEAIVKGLKHLIGDFAKYKPYADDPRFIDAVKRSLKVTKGEARTVLEI